MGENDVREQEVVPEAVIRRIFAPVDEVERIDVPGVAGSWVGIRRMDKYAWDAFRSVGQSLRITQDKVEQGEANVELHTAEQNLHLIQECVMDWCLVLETEAVNSPGDVVRTELRPPKVRRGEDADRERRRVLRGYYVHEGTRQGFDREFAGWLVDQCKGVNGLTASVGNASSASSDS